MVSSEARTIAQGLFSFEAATDPTLSGFDAALAARTDLTPRSRETYRERIGHYLRWLTEHTGHEDALHSADGRERAVDAYLRATREKHGITDRTANLTLAALHVFYDWLGLGAPTASYTAVDPAGPRPLSPPEQRRLLRAAAARGPRAFALITLGLDIGPRKWEFAALDLEALDLTGWPGTLTVTSPAGRHRDVPLRPGSRAALVSWLAERGQRLRAHHTPDPEALFLTDTTPYRRLAPRTVDDAVHTIGVDAGLSLSPGILRATAEQRMLREGLAPAIVAARLGQQAPDPDRVRALTGRVTPRPRVRVPPTGPEQLDLFGDTAY